MGCLNPAPVVEIEVFPCWGAYGIAIIYNNNIIMRPTPLGYVGIAPFSFALRFIPRNMYIAFIQKNFLFHPPNLPSFILYIAPPILPYFFSSVSSLEILIL